MTTRRWFLTSAGALAGCGPATAVLSRGPRDTATPTVPVGDTGTEPPETDWPGEPGPEPASTWAAPGEVDPLAFAWGLQTGDAHPTSVVVSVRTTEPVVALVLARGVADGWEEVGRLEDLVPEDDVVQVELVDLVPDTTWAVAAVTPDGRRSDASRFRTACYPGALRVVRFGATSCLGGNEPWPTLTWAAAERLDFFVLLGDTVYADNNGWGPMDHEATWDEALLVGGLQDLTASTSVVATWDDHEVDNNWSWSDSGMPDLALRALTAFRRAIPQRTGPGGSGLWRKLAWGDTLELFVLDCRGERRDGDYVSPAQLDWLLSSLSASTARFKIVANSVPITDMDSVYFGVGKDDRWDGHPHQRDVLLDHIAQMPGVVFIAGDFHWGALASIGRAGQRGAGKPEVFCGPGGSFINPVAWVVQPTGQYALVVPRWNYVLFEADPMEGTLRVAFIGDDGEVIAERTLTP